MSRPAYLDPGVGPRTDDAAVIAEGSFPANIRRPSRPTIVDTFMFNDEADMLECRLREIGDLVDHVVLVEADVTHSNQPKAYHYADHADRFAEWADKITVVQATGLPDSPDPWTREHAQREWVFGGLARLDLDDDAIILHGDVDEIPRPLQLRNIRPKDFVVFGQRFHPFAVDWVHPEMWRGTVAARLSKVTALGSFAAMRHLRFTAACPLHMMDAGWHFSWVGGHDYTVAKLTAFAHSEIVERCAGRMDDDVFYTDGWHVDGTKLEPVTVDDGWPSWITEKRCPAEWFRP